MRSHQLSMTNPDGLGIFPLLAKALTFPARQAEAFKHQDGVAAPVVGNDPCAPARIPRASRTLVLGATAAGPRGLSGQGRPTFTTSRRESARSSVTSPFRITDRASHPRRCAIHVAARKVDANLKGELMEARIMNTQPIRDLSKGARRALVESGLWLRISFIGASGFAAGIIQLLGGEAKPISALALAIGGGVLAILGWRRAGAILESADRSPCVASTTGRDHVLAGA